MSASIHYLRPYHEAHLDDIPLIWKMPEEAPTGITIHIPDFGQRKEDCVPLLELIAATGRVAVSLDLHRHGSRRDVDARDLRELAQADYARIIWTLVGETTLDIPTVTTWARTRFGHLPLAMQGLGFGGDVALAASRLVTNVDDVTIIGGSPSWAVPLPAFGELTGSPDTRAMVFRQMLEPFGHAEDFAGQRIHFVRTQGDDRSAAIDRFKGAVLAHAMGEGGHIVTTTLHSTEELDLSDALVWWPHVAQHAA